MKKRNVVMVSGRPHRLQKGEILLEEAKPRHIMHRIISYKFKNLN